MAVGALITADAIARAELIDDGLDWDCGRAIGKLMYLWQTAQEGEGRSVASKRKIIEWAKLPEASAERFIELCCKVGNPELGEHIHFLEQLDDGRYLIVGNSERIKTLEENREKKRFSGRLGGLAKARAARERDRKVAPAMADAVANAIAPAMADAVADALAKSWQKPTAFASAFASASSPPDQNSTVGGEVAAPARVDPSDHPPTKKISADDLVRRVDLGGSDNPTYWSTVAAEFNASSFLGGDKPGADGEPFTCADPLAWAIDHASDLVAGKYRDRKPKPRAPRWTDTHEPPVDPNAPTGFDANAPLSVEEVKDCLDSLADINLSSAAISSDAAETTNPTQPLPRSPKR